MKQRLHQVCNDDGCGARDRGVAVPLECAGERKMKIENESLSRASARHILSHNVAPYNALPGCIQLAGGHWQASPSSVVSH